MLLNNNLIELNRVDNEMEQIFNGYLSASGISMTTMWILYSAPSVKSVITGFVRRRQSTLQ